VNGPEKAGHVLVCQLISVNGLATEDPLIGVKANVFAEYIVQAAIPVHYYQDKKDQVDNSEHEGKPRLCLDFGTALNDAA